MGLLDFLPVVGDVVNGLFQSHDVRETNRTNLQAVRETNAAQMDLAKYQWEQNLAQWNRQNLYNTPASQLQRYLQAGLNPYLMYSQGSSGNSTASPSYEAPNLQAYHQDASGHRAIGAAISAAADKTLDRLFTTEMKKANLELMRQKVESEIANTDLINNNSRKAFYEANIKSDENNYSTEYFAQRNHTLLSQERLNESQHSLNIYDRYQTRPASVDEMNARIDYYDQQIAIGTTIENLNKQQLENLKKGLELMDAQINNLNSSSLRNQGEAYRLQLENNLRAQGINPNDPMWARVLGTFMQDPNKMVDFVRNFVSAIIDAVTGD